jgi:pSer/pThr/pTyr-binding forkhead associated (FHA) protein
MPMCPSCQHEEIFGALFCSECGARLVQTANPGPQNDPGSEETTFAQSMDDGLVQIDSEAPINLQFLSSGRIVALKGRDEFTLGRVNENQPIIPDIDLDPYGGFEEGVSRLHATLQMAPQGITVTDLGSANGTCINGEKIPQHIPQPLAHGDVLTLGKMRIKIIIKW